MEYCSIMLICLSAPQYQTFNFRHLTLSIGQPANLNLVHTLSGQLPDQNRVRRSFEASPGVDRHEFQAIQLNMMISKHPENKFAIFSACQCIKGLLFSVILGNSHEGDFMVCCLSRRTCD